MSTVIVSEGERQLVYRIVDGAAGDERLTIEARRRADTRRGAGRRRARRMTPEEFEAQFGQSPLTANESMGDTSPRFRAAFTDAWLSADLLLLNASQRAAAAHARREAERHGVDPAALLALRPRGARPDEPGKRLRQAVRRRLAAGLHRRDGADGVPFLHRLAVGLGHRPRGDRRPDAYRIADRRLHRRR